MSFTFVGAGGSFTRSTASASNPSFTTTRACNPGEFLVLYAAADNQATGDGIDGDQFIGSISDASNNIWVHAASYVNGNGAANAGAVVCVFYCNVMYPIANGTSIGLTVTSVASRAAIAIGLACFAKDTTKVAALNQRGGTVVDASTTLGGLNLITGATHH